MLKALEIIKDHIVDLEGMALIFEEYSMYKTKDETKKAIQELTEAIEELEALEIEDRLAELEKVILDYYLDKGYKIGADGLGFKVNITTLYKWKLMHVIFLNPKRELVFQIITETPKEMFDKAFEYFKSKN